MSKLFNGYSGVPSCVASALELLVQDNEYLNDEADVDTYACVYGCGAHSLAGGWL